MARETLTRTIDDDIRSLHEEKLERDEFLRRLAEHFVYVPVNKGHVDGNFEIVVVSVRDEEGMFLPIFTSEERLKTSWLARAHEPLRIPFDEIMRQIRPDTGLVINPATDLTYLFKWFILQEYVDDFGIRLVKQEVTTEWLEQVNAEFAAQEVPHGRRAWEAVRVWGEANGGLPISMSSPRAERILAWFRKNVNPTSDKVGPIATAAFFHDTSFWPVTVPLVFGSPESNPLDLLRMPASVKVRFCADQNEMFVYLKFAADIYDYYYTIEDVRTSSSGNAFLAGFIGAGREQITQAAALLLDRRPNAKAAEASRFALEIFLKTYLIFNVGYGETEIKGYNHRLDKLLAKILDLDPASPLRFLQNKIALYPDVGARYRVDEIAPKDLWAMYYAAQTSGAIVLRPMSDRDIAKTLRFGS
jgi:hypothetical protein